MFLLLHFFKSNMNPIIYEYTTVENDNLGDKVIWL